ncbi:hypothetical protein ACFHW2_11755 [Actinomadura sp. LOL_016]|uniref:putative phage holin n=1 Tax=unclassified Actinomadura TaxID=2626254 RepID=UPI003A800336
MIEVAGTVLVVASALLAWAVCVLYHLSARWWASEVGRHVMTFTAVLASVLTLWAIGALAPSLGTWWELARLAAFTGVPISLGWRLWIVYRLQIRPRTARPAAPR